MERRSHDSHVRAVADGPSPSAAHRSMSELQADLIWRPNLHRTCSVADAHQACLELLERQLAAVLECAREGDAGVRFLLYTIAEKLDDQMVRFEIWSSDVNAKTGTLGEEPFPGAFSDDTISLFALVKERLLKILELAGTVSDDLSTVFGVLGSLDDTSSRNITSPGLQEPCDHASSIISEIDPVLQNLNLMVRPVRLAQAALRKEGSYWEHRQRFLQVKTAGRAATPSDLPSPSPSGDSDESFSSAGYPDRTMRLQTSSDRPDPARRSGVAARSIASLRDSLPPSIGTGSSAAGKSRGAGPGRGPRRPGRRSVVCPADALKAALDELVGNHFHEEDWWQSLDERIGLLLDEDSLDAMFACACNKCRLARRLAISSSKSGGGLQLDGIEDALRLLAMCILAERPFLISVLLSVEVDDRVFAGFASERQLVDETGLALGDARTLLRFKGLFFGLGITRYLRSARKEDVPPDGERTWILHEMLELTRMLSFPGGAPQDLHDRTIGDLTFTTTRRMATDRVNDAFPDLGADPVAPQSLGFLIMDMIWFLVGGSALVVYMDALRSRSSSRPAATPFEWIKRIPKKAFAKLESEPELAQAFEIAYILTHPAGRFGIDGSPRDAYSYADLHLRKLWPKFFLEGPARGASAQQPRGRDASSISTRSSATEMADPASYVEIEGDVFRWIIARYRRDRDGESDSACRVRIFKSRHGERVRFVVCDLAKDPHSTLSFEALTENLTLVPLYAFEERPAEFSVKLQPTSGTTKDCSIPYVFTFQSRDHVQLLQEALTGRTIQADAVLDTFSVVIKKHHGFEIRGFGIGFWNSRREEIQAANFGTMQIWRVLDQGQM
ncbi:hypothetical protein JHW43_009632, partial [Diplocarpon mali]